MERITDSRCEVRGRLTQSHCCVLNCPNSSRRNPSLSFHRLPKKPELRLQWLARIRRTDLKITSHTLVCSSHFKPGEIWVTSQGRRTLITKAVPSLFQWNKNKEERPRTPLVSSDLEDSEKSVLDSDVVPVVVDHEYCVYSNSVLVHRVQCAGIIEESEAPGGQLQAIRFQHPCVLQRFAGSPEDIRFYTRFPSYDHLMAFWALIEPATSRMVRLTKLRGVPSSPEKEDASSRSTKLVPIDEFFLFLIYLSTGCPLKELGERFNIHHQMVSRIIITWANFLYCLLGSVCTWLTPNEIRAHIPRNFRDYPDTQVIIDYTELRCQRLSSQLLQTEGVSSCKSHYTFKAMVGFAPHGPLTFVSALYEASLSDTDIFKQSGIIPLLSPDMAVMVKKDILIDNHVPGWVYRLSLLSEENQMSADYVPETEYIAHLRVHVVGLIRRVKENKLFNAEIPLPISGSINQLFTVACLLSNYQNGPRFKKKAEV